MNPLGPDNIRGTADDFTTLLDVPCDLNDPDTWQYNTDPFCEPALMTFPQHLLPCSPSLSVREVMKG